MLIMCDDKKHVGHMYMFFLSTSEGRRYVKHFAVLVGGGFPSINVDGTIHNAKLAASEGIEIFAFGKFSLMSESMMVLGPRITVLYLNAKLASVPAMMFVKMYL